MPIERDQRQAELPSLLETFIQTGINDPTQKDRLLDEAQALRERLMRHDQKGFARFNSELTGAIRDKGLSKELGIAGGTEAFEVVQSIAFVGYKLGKRWIPPRAMGLLRVSAFQQISESQTDSSRQLTMDTSNRTVTQALRIGRAFREVAIRAEEAQVIHPSEQVVTDDDLMRRQIDEILGNEPLRTAFDRSLAFRELMSVSPDSRSEEFDNLIGSLMMRVLIMNGRQNNGEFFNEKARKVVTATEFIHMFDNRVSHSDRSGVLATAYTVGFDIGDISTTEQIADIIARQVMEYYSAIPKSDVRSQVLMDRLIDITKLGAKDRDKYDKSLMLHPRNPKIWRRFVETLDLDGEAQT
ncbi:hypothetical protein A3F34_00570 [Candidatus Roizmanbacteria bacterium RIFCSPHIGHO2_12_FULL_44_10]|uniref:Uncharacterized protein n=1 Tax=Candidatus Roizmanbacteria bacterium RIFCSPHIGHO2_12_FULL_44_10 TaxID=1802054 RepID=A0A1F7I6D1_9BACT|nr:MAG: hypothetical protein A3F34_00570 [Candidatus Roizmanbacteria bacterium RIFCSPHIGHO2_12_FULL_44_10]